jgi:ABC-type antimicrobial peptide transport system permease subunit
LGLDPADAVGISVAAAKSSTARFLVVRSGRDHQDLAPQIRGVLHELDPGLPVNTEKRDDEMTTMFFGPKMATIVLGIMGAMGAILSIVGIFGLAAYTVGQRLRELGIRMALGARKRELLKAALERAVRLLAFGSAAGLALGQLASRVLALVVYEATPRDPVVLAGVVLAMALLGVIATWIPAQRALRVDPMALLREE